MFSFVSVSQVSEKKGKDVDLYSASMCLQDSSNAHFVTETEPQGRIYVTAVCKQPCAVTQQPATGSTSQPV